MTDLISRQVAIDAILTEVDEIDMPNVESRRLLEVTAWMPLPEPYKQEENR